MTETTLRKCTERRRRELQMWRGSHGLRRDRARRQETRRLARLPRNTQPTFSILCNKVEERDELPQKTTIILASAPRHHCAWVFNSTTRPSSPSEPLRKFWHIWICHVQRDGLPVPNQTSASAIQTPNWASWGPSDIINKW